MGLLGNPYLQGLLAGPEAIRVGRAQQRQALLPPARGSLIPAPQPIRGAPDDIGSGLRGLGQGLADIADAKMAADARSVDGDVEPVAIEGPSAPEEDGSFVLLWSGDDWVSVPAGTEEERRYRRAGYLPTPFQLMPYL